MRMKAQLIATLLGLVGPLGACAGDDAAPSTYTFESRFTEGASSVDYAGQVARYVLMADLEGEMEAIDEGVRGGGSFDLTTVDEPGEVVARLNAFFRAGTTDLATRPLPGIVEPGDTLCQADYTSLGDKNLVAKIAGEDDVTDHRDWDGDEGGAPAFVGFADASGLIVPAGGTIATPLGLADALFETFESQVRACALVATDCPRTADGDPLPLYVTPEGLHLLELTQTIMLGAIHFSQGTDDYLDDDVDDKGLRSDNVAASSEGPLFTGLEHAWDEGFGYFGAAADYGDYTDEELAGAGGRPGYANGYHDTDGDGCIDVFTETTWNLAGYAAKRDRSATSGLDLSGDAFGAFVAGRDIIARAQGALDADAMSALRGQRDAAVGGWERVLAANVMHYLNETRADMALCGAAGYDPAEHAGHWSEMKGFAIGLQFNPRSPFSTGARDIAALHASLGDQPTLCAGDLAGYDATLLAVRDTLRAAYGFTPEDAETF